MARQNKRDTDFTEYVQARTPWLRRIAYLLCQDWHRADDLTQATPLKLYLNWDRARRASHFDAYVRTILVRTFLNEQRTTWWARMSVRESSRSDSAFAGFSGGVEDMVDLGAALAEVPPRQRAALVLRYYCDLSVTETAELLDCSPGTVKSQTSRGLVALRLAVDTHPATQS